MTVEQEEFQKWCWKVTLMLKLHPSQVAMETYRSSEDWMSPSLMGVTWGELKKEEDMVDVYRGIRSGGILAAYVALCTSTTGTQ